MMRIHQLLTCQTLTIFEVFRTAYASQRLTMWKLLKHSLQAAAILMLLSGATQALLAQHDYKVSRNQIRKGDLEAALETLKNRIQRFPKDSEWRYQMAIAQASSGNLEEAMQHLQQALDRDVAPGRAVADSRDLLKPLRGVERFAKLLEQYQYAPTQGPMLGHITDRRASLWLRTAGPAQVTATFTDEQGASHQSAPASASAEQDYTAVLRIEGLRPATRYQYELTINNQKVSLPYTQAFRTWPAEGSPAKFSFAFGGGAGYVPEHERAWATIQQQHPDALLLLGDNMYSDDPTSPRMQRFCYYRRQSPLPLRSLVAATAVYSIWDDHDFGVNDCSGGPKIDEPSWKRPVWNIFRQNWVNPSYGGGEQQPGCWYDFRVGDVHFIMLDGRYYRDPKGKSMLGPAQMAWLRETLRSQPATFTVMASPVPWDFRTKDNSRDTWNGFRQQRGEIFDFLVEQKIGGVVLISADRHRSDAWKIDRPNGYTLYEFNSSRLTNNHVHKTMPAALFSYNKKQSFGLVRIDTTAADPTIAYHVMTIDGERVHTLELKRSQLQ